MTRRPSFNHRHIIHEKENLIAHCFLLIVFYIYSRHQPRRRVVKLRRVVFPSVIVSYREAFIPPRPQGQMQLWNLNSEIWILNFHPRSQCVISSRFRLSRLLNYPPETIIVFLTAQKQRPAPRMGGMVWPLGIPVGGVGVELPEGRRGRRSSCLERRILE